MPVLSSHLSKFCPFSVHFFPTCFPYGAAVGDGVGVLTQLPHALFAAWAAENGWKLGDAGDYGVGMLFVPENLEMEQVKRAMEAAAAQEPVV